MSGPEQETDLVKAAHVRRARRLTGFYLHGFGFAAANGLIALLTQLLKIDDPEGRIGFALAIWAGAVVLHGLWAYGVLSWGRGRRGTGAEPPQPPSSSS